MGYSFSDPRLKELNQYSTQLIKETIIPKLTKELNSAKRYAPLRQVYYSLIMAQWFKNRFYGRGGLYSWLIDKKNLTGLTSKDLWSKTTYFKAYKKSFKDGEYNLKEPVYTPFGQSIRSYISGGINFGSEILEAVNNGLVSSSLRARLPSTGNTTGLIEITGGMVSSPFSGIEIKKEAEKPGASSALEKGTREEEIKKQIEKLIITIQQTEDARARASLAYALGQALANNPSLVDQVITVIQQTKDDEARARLAYALARALINDPGLKLTPEQAGVLITAIQQTEEGWARARLADALGRALINNPSLLDPVITAIQQIKDDEARPNLAFVLL